MKKVILVFVFCFYVVCHAQSIDRCGGDNWIAYGNEKCFKLIKESLTHKQAAELCMRQGLASDSTDATIASINSPAESEFIMKHVVDSSVRQKIWIKGSNSECSTLKSNDSEAQENTVSCELKNWALCEKSQTLSMKDLQRMVLDSRKEVEELKSKLALQNPIPIGFVYIQHPAQGRPFDIWETGMLWEEITSQYAGHFFRVLGGGSAAFNAIQEDNTRRITYAQTVHTAPGEGAYTNIPDSGFSGGVTTGKIEFGQETTFGLVFHVAGGEVRPRNSAVRVWKRVG